MDGVGTWTLLLRRCFHQRVGPEKFEQYVKLMNRKTPIASDHIASVLLSNGNTRNATLDPLLPLYVEKLLSLQLVYAHRLLGLLLSQHKSSEPSVDGSEALQESQRAVLRWTELEHALISCLVKVFSSSDLHESKPEIRRTLQSMSAWMSSLSRESTAMLIQSASSSTPDVARALSEGRENVAALLVSYLCRTRVNHVLKMGIANGGLCSSFSLLRFIRIRVARDLPTPCMLTTRWRPS